MTAEALAGVLLVAVPLLFNAAFIELGRSFEYPAILRKEPREVLQRFAAGGPGLLLRWELLLLSALGMIPVAVLLAVALRADPVLTALSTAVGVVAAVVQGLGLVRWPFAVPELARRHAAAPSGPAGEAERRATELLFETLHRLLGVGIGEHLGYLFTGLWTMLVAASILTTQVVPFWLGLAGIPIGIAVLIGVPEFVGPNEPKGWPLAGAVVPIAYIVWSLWLVVTGIFLLI